MLLFISMLAPRAIIHQTSVSRAAFALDDKMNTRHEDDDDIHITHNILYDEYCITKHSTFLFPFLTYSLNIKRLILNKDLAKSQLLKQNI